MLPYAARLGRPVPPWTFAVDGVTSISVDLHKYAYAPKGTSILLHRTPELRRPQYFASARWPGYTMLNPTMQSTKSGGPLAGAWAVVNTIGDEGYLALTEKVLDGVDRLVEGIARIDGLRVVVRPESTLVAFATDGTCDVFTITDAMTRAGWYVQPQLSFEGHEPTIHLSLSAATADHVEEFLDALGPRRRRRPSQAVRSRSTPASSSSCQALDAATLSDEDFDGLLAAVGMAGGDGGSACRSRWPRSTPCSTSPPRPSARPCSRPSSTGSSDAVRLPETSAVTSRVIGR